MSLSAARGAIIYEVKYGASVYSQYILRVVSPSTHSESLLFHEMAKHGN